MHMLKKATDAVTSAALYNSPPQGVGSWYCKVDLLAARLKGGLLLFVERQQRYDQHAKREHQTDCFVYCHDLTPFLQGMSRPPLRSRFYCTSMSIAYFS